jgi:two-component sensor histidine kinase
MPGRSIPFFFGPRSALKVEDGVADNVVRLRGILARPHSLDVAGIDAIPKEPEDCVDAVVRLHPHLPHARAETAVDLGACLKDVAGAVVAALSVRGHLSLRVECEDKCLLPSETAMPICLIVLELITNSVKHAHPAGVEGQIQLECRRVHDGMITVEVSDDGVGMPEGLDPMKAKTLGMRLVRALAARAGARIGFRQDPLGLSFVLRIPAGAPA